MGKLNLKKFQAFGDAKLAAVPDAPVGMVAPESVELNSAPRGLDSSLGDHSDEKVSVSMEDPHAHAHRRNAMPQLKHDYEHAGSELQNVKSLLQPVKKEQPSISRSQTTDCHNNKRRGAVANEFRSCDATPVRASSLFQNTKFLLQKVPRQRRASIPAKIAPRHAAINLRRQSFPSAKMPAHNTLNYPFLKPVPKKKLDMDVTAPFPALKPVKRVWKPLAHQKAETIQLRPANRGARELEKWQLEHVNLKPIPRKTPLQPWQQELVKLKPAKRNSNHGEDWKMEEVALKPVPRDTPPKEEDEKEDVILKPIPVKEPEPEPVVEEIVEEEVIEEELYEEEVIEEEPVEEEVIEEELVEEIVEESVVEPESAPAPVVEEPRPEPPVDKNTPIRLQTSDVYVAFTIPDLKEAPTPQNYEKLAKTTQKFYQSVLKKKFPTFQSVKVEVHRTLFNMEEPSSEYNAYCEWDIETEFKNSPDTPDRLKLTKTLVKANLKKYLTSHVSTCFKTPFRECTGVFIQQVNSEVST